jgi:hypothetical protein
MRSTDGVLLAPVMSLIQTFQTRSTFCSVAPNPIITTFTTFSDGRLDPGIAQELQVKNAMLVPMVTISDPTLREHTNDSSNWPSGGCHVMVRFEGDHQTVRIEIK